MKKQLVQRIHRALKNIKADAGRAACLELLAELEACKEILKVGK